MISEVFWAAISVYGYFALCYIIGSLGDKKK